MFLLSTNVVISRPATAETITIQLIPGRLDKIVIIFIGGFMEPSEDPNNEGNSIKYHTGKLCIEGCGRPAGTGWGPHWCQPCNAVRLKRISGQFENMLKSFK